MSLSNKLGKSDLQRLKKITDMPGVSKEDLQDLKAIMAGSKGTIFDTGKEKDFEKYAKEIDAEEAKGKLSGKLGKGPKAISIKEVKVIPEDASYESHKELGDDEAPADFKGFGKHGKVFKSSEDILKGTKFDTTPEAGIEESDIMNNLASILSAHRVGKMKTAENPMSEIKLGSFKPKAKAIKVEVSKPKGKIFEKIGHISKLHEGELPKTTPPKMDMAQEAFQSFLSKGKKSMSDRVAEYMKAVTEGNMELAKKLGRELK